MSNNKYHLGIALVAGLSMANVITAQTNVFPTTGNVGIGTTSPEALLQVGTGGASATATYAAKAIIQNVGAVNFSLSTGINTNAAVVGRITTLNAGNWNSANESSVNFYGVTSIETVLSTSNNNVNGDSGGHLAFLTKGDAGALTERVRITAAGNVGIGTTSPETLLQVGTGGASAISTYAAKAIIQNVGAVNLSLSTGINTNAAVVGRITTLNANNGNSGNESSVNFYGVTSIETVLSTANNNVNGDSGGHLAFLTKGDAGALAERVRITAAGNVGIGTTSPDNKLEIGGGNIGLDNGRTFRSKDNAGLFQQVLIGRYSDNATYLDGGTGGMYFRTNNSSVTNMYLKTDGNVGIGTTSPSEKLSVNGNIKTKKLIVTQTGWPDYVFSPAYKLKPLSELEQFIQKNKRLPEMPSAREVEEKGISVGDNQALLLKKIEELTLYLIQQQKQIEMQANEIRSQALKIKKLQNKPL